MPSLKDLLKETMFMTAAVSGQETNLGTSGRFNTITGLVPNQSPQHLWEWHHDAGSSGDPNKKVGLISQLECFVPAMKHRQKVCTSIKWSGITVSIHGKQVKEKQVKEKQVHLETKRQFLLQRRLLNFGKIIDNNTHQFWQLGADIDSSLLLVFGYDVDFANLTAKPLANVDDPNEINTVTEKDDFMPNKTNLPLEVGVGEEGELRVRSTRVIVALQLICCKAHDDFFEIPALESARIYPLIMMMCNRPLDRMTGSIIIKRPSTTSPKMDHEQMTPEISSILFADSNTGVGAMIKPFWDEMFDYYMVTPPADTYHVIHRLDPIDTRPGRVAFLDKKRTIKGSVKKIGSSSDEIVKMPGQGEFDNLHMAPKMISPEYHANFPSAHYNSITMAPFCAHDCLHFHWRWSKEITAKQNLGWDGFTPFKKPGAPQVPPNQKISISLGKPNDAVYLADIRDTNPNEWQVIMHHGGAYALETLMAADAAKTSLSLDGTWATFYWNLRFGTPSPLMRTPWNPKERVKILYLKKLRFG